MQEPNTCVGTGNPPHKVVELTDWMSADERAAFADAIVALASGSSGLPLARIHAHTPVPSGSTALPFPGSVGSALSGCPVGTTATADDECVVRPRFDVERSYVSRGGEANRAEAPKRLMTRLQCVPQLIYV